MASIQTAMPLVIPKSGPVQYVRSEEVLAEILGHDDFDGEGWAIGDRLIFEDGTESRIKQEPGERFHTWDDPMTPPDFEDVKRAAGVPSAGNWAELFATFKGKGGAAGRVPSTWVNDDGLASVPDERSMGRPRRRTSCARLRLCPVVWSGSDCRS